MARGDILLINLPVSDKREQSGLRPAVALQTDAAGYPMLMVAPITSNLNAEHFTFAIKIEPSIEKDFETYISCDDISNACNR